MRESCSRFARCFGSSTKGVARALAELERDLETGAWAEQVERHLPDAEIDLGYRLVVGDLG